MSKTVSMTHSKWLDDAPILAGGFTGGSKSSSKLPFRADSSLMRISNVWSGLRTDQPDVPATSKAIPCLPQSVCSITDRDAREDAAQSIHSLDDQSIQRRGLRDLRRGRVLEVFLLPLARLGVLMTEDEVHLVCRAALVRTKHDGERRLQAGHQRTVILSSAERSS